MPDAPAATPSLSTTSTSSPAAARCHAVDRPWTPAPITRCFTERIGSVQRRFPALEDGRAPVSSDRARALHPRSELGLGELAVLLLEADAVRVAGLEVRDQHLARELVLAAGRDREVDLDEGVGVAIEDRRRALLLQQLDVLEPVDVRARRCGLEVDPLDQRGVLLVGVALAREELGVERDDLLRLSHESAPPPAARRSGSRGSGRASS